MLLAEMGRYSDLQKAHAARAGGYRFSDTSVAIQPSIRCHLRGCGCEWNTFVWVSQRLQCIWFEIPKNASSSLKDAVSLLGDNPLGFELHRGSPDDAVEQFPGFKRFAILRKPLDRFISVHRMFCRAGIEFRQDQLRALFGIEEVALPLTAFLDRAVSVRNHHWEQMARFLPTAAPTSLFRMEKAFPDALSDFFRRELGTVLVLPRLNATGTDDGEELTTEMVARIRAVFPDDLTLYESETHQEY
jgi:hypothetical protein